MSLPAAGPQGRCAVAHRKPSRKKRTKAPTAELARLAARRTVGQPPPTRRIEGRKRKPGRRERPEEWPEEEASC
jgi:hypothetical protein